MQAQNLIDGESTEGSPHATIEVFNPANNEQIGQLPLDIGGHREFGTYWSLCSNPPSSAKGSCELGTPR